jgi:hypothetical protein
MIKVYRVKASASIKPKGERKFHRFNQTIEIDASVLSLSKEALQTFVEASIKARWGNERVSEVRWVEIEEGVIVGEATYWKE